MASARPTTLSSRTRSLVLAAGLAALLPLTACTASAGDATTDATSGATLRVAATTTQLADFASIIGGDDVEVQGLLHPGASAHSFDPSPADLLALSQADVLVVNGLELESFIDSAIEASGFTGEIITASDGIDFEEAEHVSQEMASGVEHDDDQAEAGNHDHDHVDHDDDHDHDHAAEAATTSHDGHDHGAINPHIWTSPRQAQGMVAEVANGLAKAAPAHAADFEQRAADYDAQLTALDHWIETQFERVPEADRVLVTGHDSLSYYLHDYDIAFAGAILPSFEDNAEPSASDIDTLVTEIKRLGVKAIFVESSMSPKLARTIARESGAQVIDADSLYADALGVKGSGAETYIDATAHNTRVILEAWGFDPDPLPAGATA